MRSFRYGIVTLQLWKAFFFKEVANPQVKRADSLRRDWMQTSRPGRKPVAAQQQQR